MVYQPIQPLSEATKAAHTALKYTNGTVRELHPTIDVRTDVGTQINETQCTQAKAGL